MQAGAFLCRSFALSLARSHSVQTFHIWAFMTQICLEAKLQTLPDACLWQFGLGNMENCQWNLIPKRKTMCEVRDGGRFAKRRRRALVLARAGRRSRFAQPPPPPPRSTSDGFCESALALSARPTGRPPPLPPPSHPTQTARRPVTASFANFIHLDHCSGTFFANSMPVAKRAEDGLDGRVFLCTPKLHVFPPHTIVIVGG